MMYLIHTGSFVSRNCNTWRIDLLRDLDEEPEAVGALQFPADAPLTIEWDEVERWDVLQGSGATLKILSPGDRTYADLYAIRVGEVRMDVWRNDALFWSGTLDTEFYEEPYEQARNYTVELTFSDLGVLERLKYNLAGNRTLHDITLHALTMAGLGHLALDDTTYISLTHTDGQEATPATISVASDNFYDEDGEPCTLEEVVEGIMQPLGLRLVQREGKVWVYDLYALQEKAVKRRLQWTADSQMMSTAPVVNNVRVTFSPYAEQKPLADNIVYGQPYDPLSPVYNLSSDLDINYAYYPACDGGNSAGNGDVDYNNISFRIWIGSGEGLAFTRYGYFKIEPIFGGNQAEGSPFAFKCGTIYNNNNGATRCAGNFFPSHLEWLRSNRFFLPKLDDVGRKRYLLKLIIPMLMDGRYNPFTSGKSGNMEDRNESIKKSCHHVYAAVDVHLYTKPGDTVPAMHWSNRDVANEKTDNPSFNETLGQWVEGADGWNGNLHDGWIDYYDKEEYAKGSPVGKGWINNRQCLGTPRPGFFNVDFNNVGPSITNREDGQYIAYPPEGGWIEIGLYLGIWPMNGAANDSYYPGVDTVPDGAVWDALSRMRWLLAKAPEVEIVDTTLALHGIEQDDIEYTGTINPDAKEEVTFDTICGTATGPMPTSRGCYLRTDSGIQLTSFARCGHTDQAERLLIGMIYGQAARRKTVLTGEADVETTGGTALMLYTERNQPEGTLLMTQAETLDALSDTTEVSVVEVSSELYIPKE